MSEILISGYYGFQNSGDDSLLLAIIQDIKREIPNAEIVVLSFNPEETTRIYGVRAVNRLNLAGILREMRRASLLISGGGTLIQDGTSSKSLWYYLAVIELARMCGVRVMLYANGIGPVYRNINRKKTKKILNKIEAITVRDSMSLGELARLGVTKPEICATADPAFSLSTPNGNMGEAVLKRYGVDMTKKRLCISVRKWKTITPEWEKAIAEAIDETAEKYDMYPVFFPMQIKKDYEISARISGMLKRPSAVLNEVFSADSALSVMSNMDLCIGMRLHTLIYSVSQCVPVIGLVYDPKIQGFLEYIGQKYYLPLEQSDKKTLVSMADEVMSRYNELLPEMDKTKSFLACKARENAVIAGGLFKKGRRR